MQTINIIVLQLCKPRCLACSTKLFSVTIQLYNNSIHVKIQTQVCKLKACASVWYFVWICMAWAVRPLGSYGECVCVWGGIGNLCPTVCKSQVCLWFIISKRQTLCQGQDVCQVMYNIVFMCTPCTWSHLISVNATVNPNLPCQYSYGARFGNTELVQMLQVLRFTSHSKWVVYKSQVYYYNFTAIGLEFH